MHRLKTNFVDDANVPVFFLQTPIPTELKVRLFRNIGYRRYNESTHLIKRMTRQNIPTLDLCTITARRGKVLILGTPFITVISSLIMRALY